MSSLETLLKAVEQKKQEIKELDAAITAIYIERQKTCSHPNRKSTKYEHSCDHCGWSQDRSF